MNFGKGMFLWKLIYCEGGNPQAIANTAEAAGLDHVLFKVANWQYAYNVSADIPAIVAALKQKGIAVWGWHYIVLNSPVEEAKIAVQLVDKYGLDGYCIDAEAECKNKAAQTTTFMSYINTYMKVPVALSSYRYPYVHPEISWKTFLQGCDYVMPQVYWMQAHNPAEQLKKCAADYAKLIWSYGLGSIPMIPTGAAFYEYQWKPTLAELNEFMDTSIQLGHAGFNFWEWRQARVVNPEFWPVISSYKMPDGALSFDDKVKILWREAGLRGWNLSL